MYDCIYGGRMEEEWDIRLLETFLKQICPDGILEEEGFTFDKNGTFHLNRWVELSKSGTAPWPNGWTPRPESIGSKPCKMFFSGPANIIH